ncbi:Sel1 repeat family [Synechococcus sp. PCC 7335]|uniref:sel1 repeat family protein n=1 Tax=Synechococcus sp. (strain ATCC 29403 / PCC 7335) TaxID=91464 RepID=UPI00017EB933|nr:sel1 repeat family protein [Synechococcus sp. PCC 7335]EDX82456.1 Sel1 repeat family [Synechococcus sp. PCC 7335]
MSEARFPGYAEYQNQDYEDALPKILLAAEQGNAEAQCMAGTLYQLGLGSAANSDKAVAWYERSSAQGYSVATNNLAGMLAVAGKVEESQRLYALSREQGFIHGPAVGD